MRKWQSALFIATATVLAATSCISNKPSPSEFSLRALNNAPFPTHAKIQITNPTSQNSNLDAIEVNLEQIPLGVASDSSSKSEIFPSLREGQSLRVYIDGNPKFLEGSETDNRSAKQQDPNAYFESKIEFKHKLSNGPHLLRAFAVKPWGESLKGKNLFSMVSFDCEEDLERPFLTYNEPSNCISYRANEPILVDFYLSNVEIAPGSNYVRLRIGNFEKKIYDWKPYQLTIPKAGDYKLELTLHEPNGREIKPLFTGENVRTITVK